jgi:uncharacterized membrane protein YiaA
MRPSFIARVIGGTILTVAFLVFVIGLYNGDIVLNKIQLVTILLLFAIAIALHGIEHSEEEIFFDWNPLIGKWKIHDTPITWLK